MAHRESVLESLEHGICKVNIDTYLRQGFMAGMREGLARMPDELDMRKIMSISREKVKERVREKIRLLRSNGRVDSGGGFASLPTQHRSVELGDVEV
jgi:fructose-bisphosphate aldolase class II